MHLDYLSRSIRVSNALDHKRIPLYTPAAERTANARMRIAQTPDSKAGVGTLRRRCGRTSHRSS